MGKAARNRRSRQQQSRAAENLRQHGWTGPIRGGSAEARDLIAQVTSETEMPCQATFLDDPLFGGHQARRVSDITPDGDLIADTSRDDDPVPALLFEPVHTIAFTDPVTGLHHEGRIDALVATGWQRVPPRFIMAGLPADGWGLYRTATGVDLLDPYGCVYASGRADLDPRWVSAAVSTGSVLVLVGPSLGVRVPPGRSPQSYTDRDRAAEFRQGRQNGLLAAATVTWHSDPPAETVTWVLLRENALAPQAPPAVYVPLLNLKADGGPRALGLTDLSAASAGLVEVPVTPHLAARVTETDVDLVRPDDETGSIVAGYLNPDPAGDKRFAAWRAAAVRHGRIVVITGSAELLTGDDVSPERLWEVLGTSHGALVPLTRDSARSQAAAGHQPASAEQPADFDDRSEYSDLLTAKLRTQDSFDIHIAETITDLISLDSLQRWLPNLWPVTCQTCGEPLGVKADLAVTDLGSDAILLSMHHSACRPSGVTAAEQAAPTNRPTSSFVAGYLAKPGRDPRPADIPVLVVNPSCEQLLLQRDAADAWRNATLDEFALLGLRPASAKMPRRTRQIHAGLRDGRLTVTTAGASPDHQWAIAPPPHICDQLRRHHGLAISVTTKLLPTLVVPDDLPAVFTDPEALTAWVDLSTTPQPRKWPTLRRRGTRTGGPANTPLRP